jgi:hypothetical protein
MTLQKLVEPIAGRRMPTAYREGHPATENFFVLNSDLQIYRILLDARRAGRF